MAKKKKKSFDLGEQYKKSWGYIAESKKFIFSIILIFILFSLVGYFTKAPDFLSEAIFNYLKELEAITAGFSQTDWIGFILWNNLLSSFFGVFLGFFFGVYSTIGAVANGYILGFVAYFAVGEGGFASLWRLFPHGIFELPAIFIALGLGLKLGISFFWLMIDFFKYYFRTNKLIIIFGILLFPLTILLSYIFDFKLRMFNKRKFSNSFIDSFRVFALIVIPLLIIAAVIEGSLIYLLS